jgi:hypothetical protein
MCAPSVKTCAFILCPRVVFLSCRQIGSRYTHTTHMRGGNGAWHEKNILYGPSPHGYALDGEERESYKYLPSPIKGPDFTVLLSHSFRVNVGASIEDKEALQRKHENSSFAFRDILGKAYPFSPEHCQSWRLHGRNVTLGLRPQA